MTCVTLDEPVTILGEANEYNHSPFNSVTEEVSTGMADCQSVNELHEEVLHEETKTLLVTGLLPTSCTLKTIFTLPEELMESAGSTTWAME